MKDLINFCLFLTVLFACIIANGQTASTEYLKPSATFHADSIYTPVSISILRYAPSNHVWLTSLNSGYVDASKKINASAIPAYVPLKKGSLFNPYSATNQIIAALLPYGSYFPYNQSGLTTYGPSNRTYPAVPFGHTPYTIRATGAPYYNDMLPNF